MDRIRDLINKRKLDAKFKRAGKGKRLEVPKTAGDEHAASSHSIAHDAASNEEAKRLAAEAAMRRMNDTNKKRTVSRTQRTIMEEARRQLEAVKVAERAASATEHQKQEEPAKSGNMASNAGVYFTCELVGEDVCMEKKDLVELMENRLRACLNEEPLLTSSLMINSLNPVSRCQPGVEVMCKYLDNLANNPSDPKYRSIRVGNKIFADKVAPLKGALEFLKSVGFEQVSQDGVEYLKFSKEQVDTEHLSLARDVLLTTEPIAIKLHRNPKIFKIDGANAPVDDNVSSAFFQHTTGDVAHEQKAISQELDKLTTLRTQAMRNREHERYRNTFMYCLIRVRYPDGWILQGMFNSREKLSAVRDFVVHYLSCDWLPFHLNVPSELPFGNESYEKSLADLRLSPAAVLRFEWDETCLREAAAAGQPAPETFMKPELYNVQS